MINEEIKSQQIIEKLQQLENKINEAAFFANLAKNSASVPLGDNKVLTRLFTGQLLYLDSRDLSLAPHLMMSGEWEMEITQLFRSLVKPDSVVFDVGANLGYFGIVAGTEIKTGSIHFFEANPDLIPLIEKSTIVNGLRNLSIVNNYAVSDKDDKVLTLSFFKDYWGSSTLHAQELHLNIDNEFQVNSITLDSYCEKEKINKVDIVKIDVESHEEAVFMGMQNIVRNNPQLKLFLEYTLNSYSDGFFELLKTSFENVYAIIENNLVPVSSEEDLKKISNEWVMLFLFNQYN